MARGLCGYHYRIYWERTGSTRRCSIEGCEKRYVARGLCRSHYRTFWERTTAKGKASRIRFRRAYVDRHREEVNAYRRSYRLRPYVRERELARARIYLASERGKRVKQATANRRRAIEAQVERDLARVQWQQICAAWGDSCAYCSKAVGLDVTLDHVIPISKGGGHTLFNVVPACKRCNTSKGIHDVLDWMERTGNDWLAFEQRRAIVIAVIGQTTAATQ